METASMPGVLKTILYIIAFYYIFRFLARLFLPILAKKAFEKAEEHLRNQQEQFQRQSAQKPNNNPPKEKKVVGEYVDFEEIE